MSLLDEHVSRFNVGVRTPDDEIVLLGGGPRYAWSREPERPAGEIHLAARNGRIERLTILYETFSS